MGRLSLSRHTLPGQVVALRRLVFPTLLWTVGKRSSPEGNLGDRKGCRIMATRTKGGADPPSKKWIDPKLVREISSRLISGATAIVVEWISKGGRLW